MSTLTERLLAILAAYKMYNSRGRKVFVQEAKVTPQEVKTLMNMGYLIQRGNAIIVTPAGKDEVEKMSIGKSQSLVNKYEYVIPSGLTAGVQSQKHPRFKNADRHPNPGGWALILNIHMNFNDKPTGRISGFLMNPQGGGGGTSDAKTTVPRAIKQYLPKRVVDYNGIKEVMIVVNKWDNEKEGWVPFRKWMLNTDDPKDFKGKPILARFKRDAQVPTRRTRRLAAIKRVARRHLLSRGGAPDLSGLGEIESGMIRFIVRPSAIVVWDLTNAGKRGKMVDKFTLYDLDMWFGPFGGDQEAPEVGRLRADVFDWPNKLNKTKDYKKALAEAKKFVERGAGSPKLQESTEKGVYVNPAGFKPFQQETKEFSIKADPKKGYTIRDKSDKANEPACFGRGKVKDMQRFFRWIQDNWDKGFKAKDKTYNQLTSKMLEEGFDFHSYCAMD